MPNLSPSEEKFYKALRDVFVGAKIEGKGGYVNLMNIKSRYFEEVLLKGLWGYIDELFPTDKEELFSKLYTFFTRYFSETGSICFQYTPLKENIYEKVYTNKDDVVLFYKTHMLYYVKSEKIWKSLDISIKDDATLEEFVFGFDASEILLAKNNEKKEVVFDLKNCVDGKIILIVNYSKNGTVTKYEEIIKGLKKIGKEIDIDLLERAISVYKKQTEVDFFINKNANIFLKEQWDLWMYQYIFQGETDWTSGRIATLQKIKDIAYKLIDYISQFEDELVKIWNKPKFVRNSHYVITFDRISCDILKKIILSPNFDKQLSEWDSLGYSLDGFDKSKIITNNSLAQEYQFFTIDTKFFPDLESEIVGSFDNLEGALNGKLYKGDNYQTLNNIRYLYKENIDCIYIDPPYNSPATEILYVNNYKHSSWLTLMENRIQIAKELLSEIGVFECAIDKQEQESIGKLLQSKFPGYDQTCVTIVHNPRGIQGDNFSYTNEYTYFVAPKKGVINTIKIDPEDYEYSQLRKWGGESERNTAKNCFYPIIIDTKNSKILGCGDVCDNDFHPNKIEKKGDQIYIYPIDPSGIERKWRYAKDSFDQIMQYAIIEGDLTGDFDIKIPQVYASYKTVWVKPKYDAGTYGKKILNNIVPNNGFDFPKSVFNVMDCILAGSRENSVILDFFPGSGTTAQAIMQINKVNKNSNRKFILAELGEHFYNVIIPRIKKLSYSSKWKDGKSENKDGTSQFIKYSEIEQYEDVLSNSIYGERVSSFDDDHTDIYSKYVFLADEKMTRAIDRDEESGTINVDLSKLYPDIDIPETLSHLLGKKIKTIREGIVTFVDGQAIDTKKLDYNMIKPLIWWK